MANSKFEHSVDEILKTLQQRQAEQPPSNDAAVDEILAGLGMGDSVYSVLKRPAGAPPAQPPRGPEKAAPATGTAPEPAAKPEPAAPARPAPVEKQPAPAEKKPAAPARPEPVEKKPAPAEQKPAQTPEPKAPQETAEKAAAKTPPAAPAQKPGRLLRTPARPAAPAVPAAKKGTEPPPEAAPGPDEPKETEKIKAPEKPAGPETAAKPDEPNPPKKPEPSKAPDEEENEPTREFDPVTGPAAGPAAGQKNPAPRRAPARPAPDGPNTPDGPDAPIPDSGAPSLQEPADPVPAIRPLETKTGLVHLNEIVNEDFTKFFSEQVAVIPPEEQEDLDFFQRLSRRLFRRRPAQPLPPPDEETLRPEQDLTGEVRLDSGEGLPDQGPVVEELNGPPEEETPPPRRRFVLPRIFGVEEPEEEGPFTDAEPEEQLDDYAAREDAPSVQANLTRTGAAMRLRCVLTGLAAALLLYLGLCAGGLLPAIPSIDPAVAPAAYFGVSLLLLALAALVSLPAMQSGFAGLFGTPSPDSMPALAVLAAAVQLIVLLLDPEAWLPESMTLFAGPAALLLWMDAMGKRMMSGVVERNFEIVSSGIDHVAAYRLRDKKLAQKAAAGLAEPEPELLVSRPTALVKGFLHQSFSERWSDRVAQRLCWVLWGCAMLAAVIAAIKGGGLAGAVTVLAGTLCLGGPLSCTLLSALPSLLMQQSAGRVGAVVPGWSAVQEMSRANVVTVSARDLFPATSVLLHGIKTFEKERIDLAILYAASVLVEGCDTLRDVFLSIIQNKTEMLYPVENLTHEVGGGFIAWVEHSRVILGGREMMQAHDIEPPSMDFENRYTRSGKYQPIYLAVSGKLFGMFVVSYRPDREVAGVLRQLTRSGISVLVKSDDFSVTAPLIQRVYRMREGSVKVLNGEERRALAPATSYLPESEGCMTHLGSFASFVGGLQAAEGAASGERAAALVQAVSVVCSCGLALLLAVSGGLAGLALPALVLYQAAWSALALAMPLLKRY